MDILTLFDIDGTLIAGDHGHKKAYSECFLKIFGIRAEIDWTANQGNTDPLVIISTLTENGIDPKEIESKLEECKKVMLEAFKKTLPQSTIKPREGAVALLRTLSKNGALIGTATGNFRSIADEKLKKAGLLDFMKFCACADDDPYRSKIIQIAIERAKNEFSFVRGNKNVFYFADTPRDVMAATEAGIRAIVVANDVFSFDELKATGAEFVLPDYINTDGIMKIVLGGK